MDDLKTRYVRQMVLPDWGVPGQERIAHARVLIVGVGGLGGTASLYLAGAGVGTLLLNDFDRVDATNLHRQLLFGEDDIGQLKVESARTLLCGRNHSITIETLPERLAEDELHATVATVDLVVDASDNFPTRDLVNRACRQHRRPLVTGACIRYEGQLAVFDFRRPDSPCYTCLFPDCAAFEPLETCSVNGISGPVAGVIGSLQAQATLDILAGRPVPWAGVLLTFDARRGTFRRVRLARDPDCRTCGRG